MKCNAVVQTSRSMKYTYRYQRFICLPVMQEIGECIIGISYFNFHFACPTYFYISRQKNPKPKQQQYPPPTQKK